MIDPNRLSLGARLAERAMTGRSDPQHLRPILYQHRVREFLAAAEAGEGDSKTPWIPGRDPASLHQQDSAEAPYPVFVPFRSKRDDGLSANWTSFGFGMASGVVCGWALMVIVVASATSLGLQPTNAAIHQTGLQPEDGLKGGKADQARAVLTPAARGLARFSDTGTEQAPLATDTTGDFAVVPTSTTDRTSGSGGANDISIVASQPEATGSYKPLVRSFEFARAAASLSQRESAQPTLTNEIGSDVGRGSDVAGRASPSAAAKTESVVKAPTPKSRNAAAKRAAISARRRAQRIARRNAAKRRRLVAALQKRAGRSSVGAVSTPVAEVPKPTPQLATALLKAHPDWAVSLFHSER